MTQEEHFEPNEGNGDVEDTDQSAYQESGPRERVRTGLSRRRALGVLAGLAGVGVASGSAAGQPGGPVWQRDVDANGNDLNNLGGLDTEAHSTITDFAGENLSIDDDGVLDAVDTRINVENDGTLQVTDARVVNFGQGLKVHQVNSDSVTVSADTESKPARLSVQLGSDQSIPNDVLTQVRFDEVNLDDAGGHDASTGVYTIQRDGDYHVDVNIEWIALFDEDVIKHSLEVNGVPTQGLFTTSKVTGVPSKAFSKTIFGLTRGDTIGVKVRHNAGTSVKIDGSTGLTQTFMTINKVG